MNETTDTLRDQFNRQDLRLRDILRDQPGGVLDLGNGVIVRQFEPEDVAAWAEIEYDAQLKGAWGVPKASRTDWMEAHRRDLTAGGMPRYGALWAQNGGVLGRVGLGTHHVSFDLESYPMPDGTDQLPMTEVDLFFWATGQGLGTRVVRSLQLALAARDHPLPLGAKTHPDHPRPIPFLERQGFERWWIDTEDHQWWLLGR